MAKTWKLTVDEVELRVLIAHHAALMAAGEADDTETSARIHDLTKRLNKDTPDIENDTKSNGDNQQTAAETPAAPQGW